MESEENGIRMESVHTRQSHTIRGSGSHGISRGRALVWAPGRASLGWIFLLLELPSTLDSEKTFRDHRVQVSILYHQLGWSGTNMGLGFR